MILSLGGAEQSRNRQREETTSNEERQACRTENNQPGSQPDRVRVWDGNARQDSHVSRQTEGTFRHEKEPSRGRDPARILNK